jgi:uncharacterized lipoprotein YajG
MKRLSVILLLVGTIASGCAFATHKAVVVNPDVSVTQSDIGQGKRILTYVADERPKSTLGTRGVRGIGSEISVEGDLSQSIKKSINDGLKRANFSPVETRTEDGRELRVEIRNLDYTVIQGFWSGTLKTECGLKAICIIGNNRPYEKLYRGEFEESIQVIQSEEANERYINSAVSKAINALLNDQQLLQSLSLQKQP